MIANFEFIKNRSFEISWATFRCTALFKNEKLKKEMESAAIDLITHCDEFNFDLVEINEIAGQFRYVDKLVALIKLAEATKELNTVNAKVLQRELYNLSEFIRRGIIGKKQKKEAEVIIDGMFSAMPDEKDVTDDNFQEAPKSNILPNNEVRQNEAIRQDTPKSYTTSFSSAQELIKQSGFGKLAGLRSLPNSAIVRPAVVSNTVKPNVLDQQKSWQDLIFKKILEVGQISTRELTAYFPEISERTIRFYLQKLVESGIVKRVGSTGPGSYYKIP